MSPAVRLCGFLLLVAALFTGAYAVGAAIGPVSVRGASHPPGAPMHMGGMGQVRVQAEGLRR
jgi:hypothetical protein